MMQSDTVSVVIPVYNNTLYLIEAIDSVLKQSYSEYEIIVIDDGSTVDIKGALNKYLAEFPNISYFRQDNQGPGPARNMGIRLAEGKWIAFLDADDIWCPTKLERQVEYIKKHPDSLVSGGIQGLNCTEGEPALMDWVRIFKNFATKAETLTYFLEIPYTSATSTFMVRKDILIEEGMFDESFFTDEDEDLLLRLVRKYPFYCIQEIVQLRRKHGNSMTATSLEPRFINKYNVLKKILQLVDDSEICKDKNDILGYWTEQFARRHFYWKSYGYAGKWLVKGLMLYPRYYSRRMFIKMQKIFAQTVPAP